MTSQLLPELLTMNMTQWIEMRAMGKTTELAREKAYGGLPTYQSIEINLQSG